MNILEMIRAYPDAFWAAQMESGEILRVGFAWTLTITAAAAYATLLYIALNKMILVIRQQAKKTKEGQGSGEV